MRNLFHLFQAHGEKSPPVDSLEITTDQERRKVFLRYVNRAWLTLGIVTLTATPIFPEQRSEFLFLIALIFPTYIIIRSLNLSGRTRFAGVILVLSVNFGFYGLFMVLVRELGAYKAFETESAVWLLMGLAVLFAGAFVDKWAAPIIAGVNSILLIATRLTLAPGSDPRPSALVFWWMIALTIWLYEGTLHEALRRTRAEVTERQHADKAIQEAELKYRMLVERLPVAVYTSELGVNNRWHYISPQIKQLLGFTQAEWLADPTLWYRQVHPDDRNRQKELEEQSWDFQESFEGEYRMFTRDGGLIWVRDSAHILPPQNNDAPIVQGILMDITERKLAEEALSLSQTQLLANLNSTPNVAVQWYDKDGRILYWNPASESMYGWTSTDAIGKTLGQLIHTAEEQAEFIRILAEVQETGKPFGPYEAQIRHRDGTDGWVLATTFSIPMNDEQIGFVCMDIDISARKQAEEELRQSENRYRNLFNTMEEGVAINEVMFDESGNAIDYIILDVNPAFERHSPYKIEDALGKRATDLYRMTPEFIRDWWKQHKQKQQAAQTEYYHEPSDRWFFITTTVPEQGRFATIFLNITERKQAEQTLHQRTSQLEALREIGLELTAELDVDKLLHSITTHALDFLHSTGGGIYLCHPEQKKLEWVVAIGTQVTSLGTMLEYGDGLSGKVWEQRKPIIVDDYEHWEGRAAQYEGKPFKAVMGVPIIKGDEFLGVLVLLADLPGSFDLQDASLLELFAGYAAVAIHNARLFQNASRRAEEFTTLYETTHDLAIQQDLSMVMNIITKRASSLLNVPNATIILYDPKNDELEIAASIGPDLAIGTRRKLGDGLAGRVAQTRLPLIVQDYQHWEHRSPLYEAIPYTTMMGVPLLYGGNLLGVLDVSDVAPSTRTFSEVDVRLLSLFAGQAASAIANAQLFEDLKKSNNDIMSAYDTTIEGWSRAMDLRDHETEGHTLRVTDLTLKLARRMGVSEVELTHIRRGSLLHDIGKMGVPDAILLKEGNLTEEEWVMMRKHPEFAYEMLSSIDYLHDALDIPSNHHEKWDGSGYPRGLKGGQIPMAARIFSVVDVWDAIRSDRPYRQGWDTEKAIEYIKSQAGSHFDPNVVKNFLNVLREE